MRCLIHGEVITSGGCMKCLKDSHTQKVDESVNLFPSGLGAVIDNQIRGDGLKKFVDDLESSRDHYQDRCMDWFHKFQLLEKENAQLKAEIEVFKDSLEYCMQNKTKAIDRQTELKDEIEDLKALNEDLKALNEDLVGVQEDREFWRAKCGDCHLKVDALKEKYGLK